MVVSLFRCFSRMAIYLRREPKTRLWGILFGFRLLFNKKGSLYCIRFILHSLLLFIFIATSPRSLMNLSSQRAVNHMWISPAEQTLWNSVHPSWRKLTKRAFKKKHS